MVEKTAANTMDCKTNIKSVIEEIKATNPIEALIMKQQLSYFGHIMRRKIVWKIRLCWEWVAVQEREADHEHAG